MKTSLGDPKLGTKCKHKYKTTIVTDSNNYYRAIIVGIQECKL